MTKAQQYKKKFIERIRKELAVGNPLVEAVRLELAEPVSPRPFLNEPPFTVKANERLLGEAAELNRSLYTDLYGDGINFQEPELPRFVN